MVNPQGLPIGVQLTISSRNDLYACQQVLKEIPKASEVVADRAYDAKGFRAYLEQMELVPNIAFRSLSRKGRGGIGNLPPTPARPAPNPLTYRGRWVIERTFAWMEQFKRLVIRYERRAYLYEAFWQFACAILLLEKLTG